MFIPIQEMSSESRIWIYQADRVLSDAEATEILDKTRAFLESWTSHRADVRASASILHHIFLIIAADESYNSTGGCSIDTQVRFIQELQSLYGVGFFDRHRLAFEQEGSVSNVTFETFENLARAGKVGGQTLVFNNLATRLRDLEANWKTPFAESWQKNLVKA